MLISEAQFHTLVDNTLSAIEDTFDFCDVDVDLENSGGVLTLRFENNTQLIFSRQAPLRQLWLAARSGGFHFNYNAANQKWLCDNNNETLGAMLQRLTREQGGVAVDFSNLS